MASLARMEEVDLGDVTLSVSVAGKGPVVLLAHGFPDDAGTFRAQSEALIGAGYRVIAPTMRGYAPSGIAASGRYDPAALGGDLVALADRFSPREPVRIMGHDWGAVAGYAAAAIAPSRVSHLAALAVPHPRAFLRALAAPGQLARSSYMLFFQLPGVADALLGARDLALVDRLWRRWSPGYTPSEREMEAVKSGIRGRIRHVLGYYRALPGSLASAASTQLVLGDTRVPTLRLHGADDGCIAPSAGEGEARHHTSLFESHVIERAGHFLHRERPDEVSLSVLSFFAREGKGPR